MTTATATQFQVGHTYSCRSACDYDTVFSFEVVARTAKTLRLRYLGREMTRRVRLYNGIEHADPLGQYSMAPVISADRVLS